MTQNFFTDFLKNPEEFLDDSEDIKLQAFLNQFKIKK